MVPNLKPFEPIASDATLRLIAPANFVVERDVVPGIRFLRGQGFNVSPCPHLFDQQGQFAGSDKTRAASLTGAFADPDVDAVICVRGGYGSPRMMDLVDWDVVAANPKPFVGFSDVTALLVKLVLGCNMPAFHGPMIRDMGDQTDDKTHRSLLEALRGTHADWPRLWAGVKTLREGKVTGPIIGGNLTVLAAIAGSATPLETEGAILLIEDVCEYIYRLDRALVQLGRAGSLKGVRGLIISDLVEVEDGNVPFGKSAQEMILSHFPGIPVVSEFPAGHGPIKATLPFGVPVTLDANKESPSLTLSV